jgi:L-malate glycosyltransferase
VQEKYKVVEHMLKVLYVLNYAGKAGTERYVQLLIEKLKDTKIEPYFAYNINGLLVKRLENLEVLLPRKAVKLPYMPL